MSFSMAAIKDMLRGIVIKIEELEIKIDRLDEKVQSKPKENFGERMKRIKEAKKAGEIL